jgi:PAS domain S-box-containing protein
MWHPSCPIRILLITHTPGESCAVREMLHAVTAPEIEVMPDDSHWQGVEDSDRTPDIVLMILSGSDDRSQDVFTTLSRLSGIPCVILSPCDDPGFAAQCIQQGAQDFLVLDQIHPDLLLRTLQNALIRHQAMEAMEHQLHKAVLRANELALLAEQENQEKSVLLAAIPSILIVVNEEGCITQWNAAAEATFAMPAAEVRNKPFLDCVIPWDTTAVLKGVTAYQQTGTVARIDDVSFTRANGERGFLGISLNPLRKGAGQTAGFLLLAADITRRKLLESQLSQAQRLESIGHLAAGIAHEVNTPIQYIGDNARFLLESFADLETLYQAYDRLLQAAREAGVASDLVAETEAAIEQAGLEYLRQEIPSAIQQSLEGIQHVTSIVQAMKEFSHPSGAEKTALDINHAIESTITVARNEWKYVADVVTELDPQLPLVPCHPSEFNQVILNILVNAAHAIGDVVAHKPGSKGALTVSTHCRGEWAEIRIQDTGGGIPEAISSKIFDPFFTTKEVGKGTGQGLAIAHSIVVEKHGGTIHFESRPGKGTTFILHFPLKA